MRPNLEQSVDSYKRLDRATFRVPECEEGVTTIEVAEHELEALLDGIDVTVDAPRTKRRRVH